MVVWNSPSTSFIHRIYIVTYNYVSHTFIVQPLHLHPIEIEIVVMSPSVESNSIDLEWRLAGEDEDIQQVFISAIYNGPCTEVQLPPKVVVLSPPMTDQYTITGLQEFSNYLVNVTLVTASGVGTRLRTLITKGGGKKYRGYSAAGETHRTYYEHTDVFS